MTNKTTPKDEQILTAEAFEKRDRAESQYTKDTFLDFNLMEEHGVTYYKAPEKVNKMVLLPRFDEKEVKTSWRKEIYVHYGLGPEKGDYLCPFRHAGEFATEDQIAQEKQNGTSPTYCLSCQTRQRLWNEGDGKAAYAYAAKPRSACLILDMRSEETMMEGPKIYIMPNGKSDGTSGVFHPVSHLLKVNYADLSHLQGNKQLMFTRTGTSITGTGYSGFVIADRTLDIPPEMVERCLATPQVESFMKFYPASYVNEKFSYGQVDNTYSKPARQDAPAEAQSVVAKPKPQTNSLSDIEKKLKELENDDD